jgi:hypothetical protein
MSDLRLIVVDPDRSRINDRWLLKDPYIKKIVGDMPDSVSFKNFVDDFVESATDSNTALGQQAFLHIITETVYNYPSTYISEKTMKPIINKRPFVMIAPPKSLANLRSLGFKTFDRFWDESYDDIDDLEKRILAVIDIVDWICQKSVDDIRNLCLNMSDILNYNFQFYITHFRQNETQKLEQACLKNLQPRYDTN